MLTSTLTFEGNEKLTASFRNMADIKGTRWKASALKNAGYKAMTLITTKANSLAPVGKTRLASRSQTPSKGNYNPNYKYDYAIFSVLSKTFLTQAPKNRKGKVIRYPYMLAAGIKGKPYERRGKDGSIQEVKREKSYPPNNFLAEAVKLSGSKSLATFEDALFKDFKRYIELNRSK